MISLIVGSLGGWHGALGQPLIDFGSGADRGGIGG